MKKAVLIFIAFVLVLSSSVTAFSYESLVDDSANLFSASEYEDIADAANEFCEETGLALAVVTTDDTQGRTTESFAEDYYDDLADFQGWPENGMLLIIDMDNRIIYADAVGDTWDIYSDSDISYITDCGYDEVSYGAYGDAMLEMIDAAVESYASEGDYYNGDGYIGGYDYNYDYDYNYNEDYEYNSGKDDSLSITDIFIYIVLGLAAGAISVFVVKSRYKNQGKGDEFDTDDVILNLTGSNDTVISRNVVTTKIPKSNNNGRPGGGGGGVSVHRSSGGRVHRSSGRRF
ncbi:MAG: TPM domain-containing protein [Clostridia bacterium]|nr:TPM domain-containing protein [Clostridia bacterium]